VYRTNRNVPSTDPCRKADRTFIQTTPLRRGKRTAFDWKAVSEANCEVMPLAVVYSKGRLSTRGRCYHAHWGGILIRGRHRHWVGDILIVGGEIIMPLFFRRGRILPGETYFCDTGYVLSLVSETRHETKQHAQLQLIYRRYTSSYAPTIIS